MEWYWRLAAHRQPWNPAEWRRTCQPWGCTPRCRVPVAIWPPRQVLPSTRQSSITRQPAVSSAFRLHRLHHQHPAIRTHIPWAWRLPWPLPRHVPRTAASLISGWRPDDTRKHWDWTGPRKTKNSESSKTVRMLFPCTVVSMVSFWEFLRLVCRA